MRAVYERFPVVILAGAAAELRARLRDRTTYVALFVMLVGVAMLFPGEGSGYATIVAGGRRVALTSTASAAVSAVLFNAFFSIVGLLAVSATLLRDSRPNGIGELLRTSPASNLALVAARWLANLALLAVFASVACVFALLIVWPRVAHMDAGAFVLCYAAIVAPVLFLLAGAGLVLDVFLRGSRFARIAVAIVLWLIALTLSAVPGTTLLDPLGMRQLDAQLVAVAHGAPVSFGIAPVTPHAAAGLAFDFALTAAVVAGRIVTAAGGLAIALLALFAFPRFAAMPLASDEAPLPAEVRTRSNGGPLPPATPARWPLLASRVRGELRFMWSSRPPWVLIGLAVLAGALGLAGATSFSLMIATLLPIVLAQRMVMTESPLGTESLIGTMRAAAKQYVPWKVLALVAGVVLLQSPYLAYALARDPLHAGGLVVADLALATVMIALSYVTGSAMPGLLVATLWWYLVSFNSLPAVIDVAGVHAAPELGSIAAYFVATVAVVAACAALRRGAALAST